MPSNSHSYQFNDPVIRRWGYAVWAAFGLMAVFFFQERALFTDAAFQNFKMLQNESFYIAHGRIGNVLPQIVPWSIMKLGGGLSSILIGYSLSFILFFAGIYWLLVQKLKNDYLGWSLILYFTLLAYDSFFHVQSELYQGVAVLLLCFGLVLYRPALDGLWQWTLVILLLVLLAFYHKLTILFFGFIWVFLGWYDRELRHRRYVLFILAFIFLVILKGWLWQSGYEDNRIAILRQGLQDYFPNFWDMPANGKFLQKCIWYYYLFPIVWGILAVWYTRRRNWRKLVLVVIGSLGYILLVHYSSPNTTYRFYAEVTYLPLGLLVGMPLIFDVLPNYSKRFTLLCLLLMVGLRMGSITYNGFQFADRLDRMEDLLLTAQSEQGGSLFREYSGDLDKEWYITDWGIPYESLLLTSLRMPEQQATLLMEDDFMELYEKLQVPDQFLSQLEAISMEKLNGRFFRLKAGAYIMLEQ